MEAMHYAITLPADYDMGIIRARVASKGPLLDDFPGLGLKAYLIRERGVRGSTVNLYAPFYLWVSPEGMGRFLWEGGGFAGLVASFGRPSVRRGAGISCLPGPSSLSQARFATLREQSIAADSDPASAIAEAREQLALEAAGDGSCLSALAVDPTDWKLTVFRLWDREPPGEVGTVYQVLHLSRPGGAGLFAAQ
ncbi:DUF4865 family protein [Labrys sp. LIt4]|uniref:DUF4865 family protein n=1 Tax=Labrys sp. LIt4 TaxID=2821355 RepID=UPI001AE035AD|nr:DUF4865 family protein [Labrys sp. LIt4]MBP0583113.1 DUF4865 family protein [Labrys sp. LIt4]